MQEGTYEILVYAWGMGKYFLLIPRPIFVLKHN